MFGYGAGQTGVLTVLPLPPHNDYLRVLAEYGLFNFLVFVPFVLSIALSIKQQAAKIIFTVLLIYFLSENLLDNFTSMALFFSYAGRFTAGRVDCRRLRVTVLASLRERRTNRRTAIAGEM